MTPYFIGLDLGTSSTKVIAFDQRGNTLVTTGVAYPTFYPAVNHAGTFWTLRLHIGLAGVDHPIVHVGNFLNIPAKKIFVKF